MTKLIFFDLDGTLVDGFEFIYQHLWQHFDIDRSLPRETKRRYLAGEISYQQWVDHDIRYLQDVDVDKTKFLGALTEIRPMVGAIETLQSLRENDYKIFIVSGSIDLVVETVYADHLHFFDEIFINRFVFDDIGGLSHGLATPYDMEGKATCIADVAARYEHDPSDCVFVGDSSNDLHAARSAGMSIAFNAKSDELITASTHHVQSSDLRDILPILGITHLPK